MSKLIDRVKAAYPVVLLAFAISNIFVSCQLVKENSPREIVRTFVVTNVVTEVSVETNRSDLLSLPISFSSSTTNVVLIAPHSVATTSYRYFLVGRRIGCQMFGRFYYEGSPCSYGVIREIYPDRIILCDGNWIDNRQDFVDGVALVGSSINKEFNK